MVCQNLEHNLQMTLMLLLMIDAHKNNVKLQQRLQLVRNGDKTDYSIEEDGGLFYKNILCAPNVQELKKKLMYESHNTVFTMHSGGNKMYQVDI